MKKNLISFYRPFSILFFLSFLLITKNFAQTVTGNIADTTVDRGGTIIVDDALIISYPGPITNASVMIATNFVSGDLLNIDVASLPPGISGSFNYSTGRLSFTGTATAAEWQYALRTVRFIGNNIESSTKNISFTIGNALLNPSNNHYYEYVNPGMDWITAKATAETNSLYGLGGYLATITSVEEDSFLKSKLEANGWMGCSDSYTMINSATGVTTYADQAAAEGNWYWICGPEKGTMFSSGNINPVTHTYSNWNTSEPNNDSGSEDYGAINNGTSRWNDLPNSPVLAYVVEYGGMPGDPVADLSHSRNIVVLSPVLEGDAATPGSFINNNVNSPVDVSLRFTSITSVTHVTVNISEGFTMDDALEYDPALLPAGVFDSYNPGMGVLNFYGTASAAEWNQLLPSVSFRTTSTDLSNRKITFSMGYMPASAEGHFYVLSDYTVEYNTNSVAQYFDNFQPELARYEGLQGYSLNISSIGENNFLQKMIGTEFWMPLTDDYAMINEMLGGWPYADQSETEGNFYWITGPAQGNLVSAGNGGSMTAQPGQYNNWENGEPANTDISDNASYFSVADGKWYNESIFDEFAGYRYKNLVIEYGGMAGDAIMNTVFTKTMTYMTTLPVSLSKFEARKENKTVVIEWTTRMEKSNSYFNVERSADNQNFSTIGRVNGSGTGFNSQHYRFNDLQPLAGISYYRLKQVDIDNHFVYSATRKIDFNTGIHASVLYPTLAITDVKVQLRDAANVQCFIINASGSIVQRISPSVSSFTIPVQSLPRGVYILKITGNGREENLRFIKQ